MGGAPRPATAARSLTGCAMSRFIAVGSRTLRPTPTTTVEGPSASPLSSTRMPPTFRWRWIRSFGHFSSTPGSPSASSARMTATPTASDKPGDESGTLLEAPAQRKREAAARDRGPDPTAATAPRGLPLGGQQRPMDVAALPRGAEARWTSSRPGRSPRPTAPDVARPAASSTAAPESSSLAAAAAASWRRQLATWTPRLRNALRTSSASRKSGVASSR